jgi:hypothetical protein
MINYSRQQSIRDLTVPSCITVIGTGAIGGWVAYLSAMSGIKSALIYTIGNVKATDLARLPFQAKHEGMPYADAIRELLLDIRGDIELDIRGEFEPQSSLLKGVVFNCATNDTPRFDECIFERCRDSGLRYITGGYNETAIYIADLIDPNAPQFTTEAVPAWAASSALVASLLVTIGMSRTSREISHLLEMPSMSLNKLVQAVGDGMAR